jgi:hypothetical protein
MSSTSELSWSKSSYSGSEGDNCVEIAIAPATVHVRDSKQEQGPQLTLTPTAWNTFITYATHQA